MGIKNFYLGFKNKFSSCISTDIENDCDVLIIELNGLFYKNCKKIYHDVERIKKIKQNDLYLILFNEICLGLEKIIRKYGKKTKKIFLVVDGVSGMMKNIEQRQRRYKNSFENKYDSLFDLNCFSPGTKILHFLTKYIDWYIRTEMNKDNFYKNIEIFFSNEKVVGEGEYKILQFIKKKCIPNETIYIYTCDSDMILLSLFLFENKITLIRNSSIYGFEYVDIKKCRQILLYNFSFDKNTYETLKDIYLLFFLLGNDYISNSPCIFHFNILYNEILPLYKKNGTHFFKNEKDIHFKNLCYFLYSLHHFEEKWIIEKYKENNSYFPDSIYLQQMFQHDKKFDFNEYKNQYKKNNKIQENCSIYFYLATIQNLFNMYFSNNFNWSFFYPFYKSPFLSDFLCDDNVENKISLYLQNYNNNKICQESFYHLITVLPPQSKFLLPYSLQNIFIDLKEYYPSYIEIDLTGKYKIWEGVVKLPMVDNNTFKDYYIRKKITFSEEEHKRNIIGKCFHYRVLNSKQDSFYSYYGKIKENNVYTELVTI